jgi:hypothetical protein
MKNNSGVISLKSLPKLTVEYQHASTLLKIRSVGPNTPFCSLITNSGIFLSKKYTTKLKRQFGFENLKDETLELSSGLNRGKEFLFS